MALKALQCPAPCSTSAKAATGRRDAEEDGALGRRKEFDASTRVTHACTEAAAMPTSEKKHCMQMMCCAPQLRKILYQESESSAKMTGSRMAFARRG